MVGLNDTYSDVARSLISGREQAMTTSPDPTLAQQFARLVPSFKNITNFTDTLQGPYFHIKGIAEVPGRAVVLQFTDDSMIALHYEGQAWRPFLEAKVSDNAPPTVPQEPTGAWLDVDVDRSVTLNVRLNSVQTVEGAWGPYVVWKGNRVSSRVGLDTDHQVVICKPLCWEPPVSWPVGGIIKVSGTVTRKEVHDGVRQTVIGGRAMGFYTVSA